MTTDCSLNYKFNAWKFKAQTWGENVVYRNCFWHSEQFLYTTCSPHVLQKEELLTKIYLYLESLQKHPKIKTYLTFIESLGISKRVRERAGDDSPIIKVISNDEMQEWMREAKEGGKAVFFLNATGPIFSLLFLVITRTYLGTSINLFVLSSKGNFKR